MASTLAKSLSTGCGRACPVAVCQARGAAGPLLGEFVTAGGGSAGGHLAALLATDYQYLKLAARSPTDIRGVIAISGVTVARVPEILAAGAHGVHVGQDDMPVAEVRELVGPEMLIGLSTHAPAEIDAVDAALFCRKRVLKFSKSTRCRS